MSARASSPLLAGFPEAYRDVVSFLARRTGNADDARELAHDVWVRLAEREREGAGPQPTDARAYLFTMAQNIAIDHLRKRRLIREHAALHPEEEPWSPDIAESLMYRQVLAIVDATLSGLPERTREVFVSHRMHGAGHADLAERFGVSRNTIERDVMTATDAVRSALEAWHTESSSGATGDVARKGRRRAITALFGVLATATTATAVWRWWREAMPQWESSLVTPRGKLAIHQLPDGSTVTLDADSQVAVRYTGATRALQLLRGAAYFSVTSDTQRPFSVVAGNVRVVVTGTRFGMELEPAGVSVQVESGSVRVESGSGPVLDLAAGDEARVDSVAPPVRRRMAPDQFTSWRNGELVFEETRLADAVARLERYVPQGGFNVAFDGDAGALPVSGRVSIAKAREWLAALPSALPMRIEAMPDGSSRIVRR
jgi:RNA polymerase sigma factor (sigma-70 family)